MKVPTYTSPRVKRASGEAPYIRNAGTAGAASGADLGNALMQAGNSLGSAGSLLTQQANAAKRFGIMQNFSSFQQSVEQQFEELKRNADPAQGNFAEQATAYYDKWEQEWLASVPDEFYDEFATRSADIKTQVTRNALAFQYERTDQYFRQGLNDQLNVSLQSLDQDGSIANLDNQRATIDAYINATTLTEAEKVALRRQAYKNLESVSYKSEVRRGNLELGALGVGSAPGDAADLILDFDGTSLENGLDYETNRELLTQRVEEAEAQAVAAVGSMDRWSKLPPRARAALISLTDDLGELPASVKEAIDSGDLEEVASAVAELSGAEGDRRIREAQIILGTEDMPEGMLDADPRFANIPYEDRLVLRADAEREAAQQQAADAAAAKAARDTAINSLMVNIYDGNAGQYQIDQAREEGWLTDYEDIKRAQDALEKRDGDLRLVQSMQAMLAMGVTLNPADEDHRKMFNTYIGNNGLAAIQQMNDQYVKSVLIPAVRTAGDLPTDTVGTLTGMMRSQDPQRALFALDTLSQLQQASPEAYDARVSDAVAADVAYWQSVKDYYPEDEVLSSVRGGTTQEERTKVKMLREEATASIKAGEINTDVAGELANGNWFQSDAIMATGVANMLNTDYQRILINEYARDGNMAKAEERAKALIGRVWAVTELGGQRTLLRYPPERAGYPTWNGSFDWITEQGRAEMGLAPDQNFQLISDAQTEAEVEAYRRGEGGPPSYLATYIDEDGNIAVPTAITGAKGEERYVPQRIYFQITEEMQAEKAQHLSDAKRRQETLDMQEIYRKAWSHSMITGIPVPVVIQQNFEDTQDAVP